MIQKIFFALLVLILPPLNSLYSAEKPLVIVSVAPYKFLVDQVAKGAVEVFLIVPAGTSAHTFEPNPKDMIKAAKADAWLTIGEAFEKKATRAIAANNERFKTYDLTKGVDLITGDTHCHGDTCHCHGSVDLHMWLSPKELKIQAATVAEVLSQLIPEQKEQFNQNLNELNSQLDQLDQKIRSIYKPADKTILVSHPAFGYFCRDYGCKQLSIEVEGKDPLPKKMHALVTTAKSEGLKKIFVQPQYSDKGATLIAKEIGAKIVVIDPYKESLFDNLIHIAEEFSHD